MKKLIIAAAISIVATVSQAATASWGFTAIPATEKSAAAAGWVGYLMAADTWSAFSALNDSAKASYVTANYLATATTTSARGVVGLSGTGYGSFSAGDTFNGYSVIFSNADATKADYIAYSTVQSATVNAAGANISIVGSFATLTSATGASGGWVAVPEPTSGLLLLLGMAGLAIRRKCA
jgi:hypothetical protein